MAWNSDITCPACFKELDKDGHCKVCGWFKGWHSKPIGKGLGNVADDLDMRLNALVALRHMKKEKELYL